MDIEQALTGLAWKTDAEAVAAWIGEDRERFEQLLELFFGDNVRLIQRSAMTISKCCDLHPEIIAEYIDVLIPYLLESRIVAVRRNVLRILQFLQIPERHQGTMIDFCFRVLSDHKEPVAVQAFAMRVAANICTDIPELQNELGLLIEELLPHGSSGIKARGRKILGELGR